MIVNLCTCIRALACNLSIIMMAGIQNITREVIAHLVSIYRACASNEIFQTHIKSMRK